ncbi:MAG: hypothetical protein J5J04_13070 [Anaerolineae bacterium]|nr:hypothetical protein [Anaerolineae bacterium]
MAIKYELMAKAGTYTDRDGNEKARWTKCGILMERDGRTSIKLEALPVNFDGWLSCFEPKPRDDKPAKPQSRKPDFDDPPF